MALRVGEQSDQTLLQNLILVGYQDTLYLKGGRSYIVDSQILGHIDFIFGEGNAVFENSEIIARARLNSNFFTDYITAQVLRFDKRLG